MAVDLATLKARLDKIDAELASSVSAVAWDGKRVEKRSRTELEAARSDLVRQIAALEPTTPRRTRLVRAFGSKGVGL